MAKKNATPPPAATPAVPQRTKKAFSTLPCALVYFFQFALKGWEFCKANLPRFTAEIPRYDEKFVDEQIAFVKEIKALPDNSTRLALTSEVLLALKGAAQAVSDQAVRLDNAIKYTFKNAALIAVQRSAAGLTTFDDITDADWAGYSKFIETANEYLTKNIEKMVAAKAVYADFTTKFSAVGTAFDNIWNDVLAKRQNAANGTDAVADGIKQINEELTPMLDDAASIFKYEPELRKLFMKKYLVSLVRNGHPATVSGDVTLPPTGVDKNGKPIKGKPIANILVEVLGEEGKSAVTKKNGRYKIQLSGGSFTLRFSGEGFATVEQQATLTPGKGRRLNVVLEPAPVAPKVALAPPTPPISEPAPDSPLTDAVTELLDKPKATNGVTEGKAA